ncbi:hypothetical protein COI75_00810 [Bacillus cereus]|nr:hypothetical protein CON38_01920 [Bacillus cereus]PFI26649.1 hypothetical protein COI75_00810 [Bacillus cereus]
MIIVRSKGERCGIFVKILTNLWREGMNASNDFCNISIYHHITTKRGCSKRASSIYLSIKQTCS